MRGFLKLFAIFSVLTASTATGADLSPVIPIGLDAYRQWDRWPYQRIGSRAYMRSTYDRTGGHADAGHFLYQLANDNNVTLDVEGPGVLYFARYNHWHGSPWRYVVDGAEHIVQETSTADPLHPVAGSVFMPADLFPSPLTWTWSTTKGADLMWVPMPFESSFRMGYTRTFYGTGYYIYHQYVRGANLSQPIRAWTGLTPPAQDVLDLIGRAGTDICPTNAARVSGVLSQLGAGQAQVLLRLTNAPSALRKLSFSVSREQAIAFGRGRLRLTWDGRPAPSIDAPVALFFGAGTLYNRDQREFLVKGFPVYIRYGAQNVELACFFPMPFFKSAQIELEGPPGQSVSNVTWTVGYENLNAEAPQVGYFHATYRDYPNPEWGKDMVFLDTKETEGGGDWSGSFVGMSWIFSHRAVLNTLEGDPRFFFDDSQTPQAYGTGTEEWGGGGDYWGGQNMTLPFAGHPVGAPSAAAALNEEDKIESAYRFLLADLMPFGKRAVIQLEHGENDSLEHYQGVTYWYGAPAPALVKTDELKVGDPASEAAHNYNSPQASAPYSITSRYEWGRNEIGVPDAPRANPSDYAEFQFPAESNKTYYIWLRGKNINGSLTSDASWLQFDEEINTPNLGASYNHPKGFGNWLDLFPAGTYAWSSALPQDPPQTITFNQGGLHRLRIQPRHWPHYIEQIWLSASQQARPDPNFAPASNANNIVLQATNAITLQGAVALTADAGSTTGRVLMMNSTGSTITVFAAHTDWGRKTTGTSEFTLRLDTNNLGVMLRRKLDYAFPNQRAEVYVANNAGGDWQLAGIWYLAGANTCVYSRPPGELDPPQHTVRISNRRFRDDEFLVPRDLTQGRSSIAVRVKFTPVNIPLFPGRPLDERAWSEIRYEAHCFVMPDWSVAGVPSPRITNAAVSEGSAAIQWTGGGVLQSATNLSVPVQWANTATGGSFSEPAIDKKFYRIVR